jgi:zinc protease
MRFRRFIACSVVVLSLVATGTWRTSAQGTQPGRDTSAASVSQYKLTDKMPLDPEAIVGKLPNGLTYYVRPNPKPTRRVELRLVVKAGSALEDDDQQGLAHFVEHMLFEGTKHFPGQGISDFLTSMGLSIGADANADTSFDETEYQLGVPTDVPGVLDHALLALEDWAGGALFEQSGIEHERGIVLSEWRLHLGAGERTEDKVRRAQLEGSRYADRPPIGKPEIIQNAKRDQLVRFYHDWYRPDLMAVIVVGDVDRDAVVTMIKSHFSSLTSPSPARPRPTFDVPEHPGTRYAILPDQEMTRTVVSLSNLRPARDQGSVGGYRAIMLDQLFGGMLSDRLNELSQSTNPPFLQAQADRSLFPMPRTKDDAVAQALVSDDGVLRGLDAIETELQRVTRFGFTATELDRAKNAMMKSYERVTTESPDRESSSRADEYTRNFLEDEALPTIWQELAFHRRFLPEVTLAELNALASDWFPERNRLVIVSAPLRASVTLPTQAQLEGVVASVAAKPLEGYVDAGAGRALMDTTPAAGTIAKTAEPAPGITEWTLSNGARVVMKPTTLKEDQILFRAFAPGGTSLASDDDFIPARVADDVVSAGGVGQFSDVELGKALSGKAVAVQPYIGELDEGLNGGSTPQDLEALFQLIYLRFTAPRADPTAFAALQSQARALVANQTASPEIVFNQAIADAVSQHSPRRAPETIATVDRWNLAKSMAFYKARFADASNFTFVFVGSFNVDTVKPLAEKYLASLPATRARETYRDLGIKPPADKVETTVQKGIAPKSAVAIVFSGPFQYDDDHILALRTMALILQSRLLDTIRQELGGTYSITVTPTFQKAPSPLYAIRIEWTCDPARTSALVQRVFDEIDFVRTTSLRQEGMASLRQTVKRELDDQQQNNGYWLGQIARRYQDGGGGDLAAIDRAADRIAALSTDAIHRAAVEYLDMSRYVKVTLMPEGK